MEVVKTYRNLKYAKIAQLNAAFNSARSQALNNGKYWFKSLTI